MIADKQKDIAQWAMNTALKNTCQAARVSVLTGTNNAFEYRNIQLDNLHQSAENKLYIELYVDGRYGSFSTNRIQKDNLESFLLNAIDSTRYLAEDRCQQLPMSERYFSGNDKELDLYDTSIETITTENKLAVARQSIDEIYQTDSRIISVSATYSDSVSAEYMIASNGLEVESLETSFNLTTEVSLKTDGHARAESYWFDSSLFWSDLQTENIGKTALDRALRKIGQRKIASGKYSMLLDNTTSSRLFFPLIGAMYGSALQQKNSFLIDRLGQKIVSDKFTVVDTPHLKRAYGSRYYDGEGVATSERKIIDKGILQTYFIDTYYAQKMNMEPTISSPSIFTVDCGNKNLGQLIQSLQKGIWITGFNGGNTNPTTGDFSFGVEGFLIENGIATTPISEMNITGNLLDMWDKLEEVGNDPRESSRTRIPSLLFNEINFSGL